MCHPRPLRIIRHRRIHRSNLIPRQTRQTRCRLRHRNRTRHHTLRDRYIPRPKPIPARSARRKHPLIDRRPRPSIRRNMIRSNHRICRRINMRSILFLRNPRGGVRRVIRNGKISNRRRINHVRTAHALHHSARLKPRTPILTNTRRFLVLIPHRQFRSPNRRRLSRLSV